MKLKTVVFMIMFTACLISCGERKAPPYEVGTVKIISGDMEYEPLSNFLHLNGFMEDGKTRINGSGQRYDLEYVLDNTKLIEYSDDFEIVVEGKDQSHVRYLVYDADGNMIEFTAESGLPDGDGEFIICVNLYWSNGQEGEYSAWINMAYWFKVVK